MLSGKCGLTYCHMGDGELGLQPLDDAIETSGNTLTRQERARAGQTVVVMQSAPDLSVQEIITKDSSS